MQKRALITGIYGQDGSYIAEILKDKGYEIHGIVQENLSSNSIKIKEYLNVNNIFNFEHIVDLNDYSSLKNILIKINPDEIYHMAAIHVSSESGKNSINNEAQLFNKNVNATLNILSICSEYLKNVKIVTAGSCLIFDNSKTLIQDENTVHASSSMYGLAKITELNLVKHFRSKGLHVSTAILYNHESSRRKNTFVTKKIVENLVAIKRNKKTSFVLGDIEVEKDWGYAKDYANAMYLMAQHSVARDYVLSSGVLVSIKSFIELAAKCLKISDWRECIIIDNGLITRKHNTTLCGDSSLAKKELNWDVKNTRIEEIVNTMVQNELHNKLY